jgi:hypothetical protein
LAGGDDREPGAELGGGLGSHVALEGQEVPDDGLELAREVLEVALSLDR